MFNKLDSRETLLVHRKKIKEKNILNQVYRDFYHEFKKISAKPGILIELGSGAGFIKELIPQVITSDVIEGPGIDKVFSATKIPYSTNSVSAFFMLNVLHHIKDPKSALQEMQRCLKPGGNIVMIEPYNSLWGKFIYQNFHHEKFDPSGEWKIKRKGRLSEANGALPWIIFVRDRESFERNFPMLKIIMITPHTPFRYLLSGGLSKPQLIPSFLYPLVKRIEKLFSPLNPFLGMFVTIRIQKITHRKPNISK